MGAMLHKVPRCLVAIASLSLTALAADPCECLNWKQMYAAKRVLCGEAYEFAPFGNPNVTYKDVFFTPMFAREKLAEFCDVPTKMDNNLCINFDRFHIIDHGDEKATGQWCYVDSKCKELNGGMQIPDKESIPEWIPWWFLTMIPRKTGTQIFDWVSENLHKSEKIPRDVSMKFCTPGKDKMLRDMDPMDLLELGTSMDVHIPELAKWAYSQIRGHHDHAPLWCDIRNQIGSGDLDKLPDHVFKAIKEEKPIVVDSDSKGKTDGSVRIIKGKKVYKVNDECRDGNACDKKWSFSKGRDLGEL